MDRVNASMLRPAIASQRVIQNGIDLSLFCPGDKQQARQELDIDPDCLVLLFAAYGARTNAYKDYTCLRAAVELVARASKGEKMLFLALGEVAPTESLQNGEIRFLPFEHSQTRMAQYYRAADMYVHAAKVDTFPNTILEAMACGTTVVATAVGGIPEQMEEGIAGYTTPMGDHEAMARQIIDILGNRTLLRTVGMEGAAVTRRRFSRERMVEDYLTWYEEIQEDAPVSSLPLHSAPPEKRSSCPRVCQ